MIHFRHKVNVIEVINTNMLTPIRNHFYKYLFPLALLLFFVSSFSGDTTIPDYVEDGAFIISFTDDFQGGINGFTDYRTREAIAIGSSSYYEWQFNFRSRKGNVLEQLELLISPPGGIDEIYEKTFKVDTNISSFLEPDHGLFGTAILESLSDLPFFTREGTIKIKEKNSQTIRGTLNLSMMNAEGKQITVKGSFAAKSAEANHKLTILNNNDHINTETPSRVAL